MVTDTAGKMKHRPSNRWIVPRPALFYSRCLTLFRLKASEDGMAHSPQFLKLVQDAKQRVKETNVPDVKRRIDAGEKLILVDVREDNEWAKGHSRRRAHGQRHRRARYRAAGSRYGDQTCALLRWWLPLRSGGQTGMGYTNVESMDGGWRSMDRSRLANGPRLEISNQDYENLAGAGGFDLTVLINSEVSYRLDHAPAADGVGSAACKIHGEESF